MARRIWEVIIGAAASTNPVIGLIELYLGLLGVCVVIGLIITGVQLLRRNSYVTTYAYPGAVMAVRYWPDALELILPTGTRRVAYQQIRELRPMAGAMFLRPHGAPAIALPTELVPPAAFELVGRPPGSSVGSRVNAVIAGKPLLGAAVVLGVSLVVVAAIVVAVQPHKSTASDAASTTATATEPAATLPDSCVLTIEQQQAYGFIKQWPSDTAPHYHHCEWDLDHGDHSRPYDWARVTLSTDPFTHNDSTKDETTPYPVKAVGNIVPARGDLVRPKENRYSYHVTCIITWPTSYGAAWIEIGRSNSLGTPDVDALKRSAEQLADTLFANLPR
ncbi:hypothetical protein [Nocardia sp.]|uniref:hypothetical protein n=1 Tax=Nocardia sp. TaxID=1821 RepID=UPI0026117F76|nr:hypothetical protein [Nocardia sp.]